MTDSFDPHISYSKIRRAGDVENYVLKEVSIEGCGRNSIHMETPIKALDSVGIESIVKSEVKEPEFIRNRHSPMVVESAVYVGHPNTWKGLRNFTEKDENDVQSFRRIIKLNKNIHRINPDIVVASVVFSRNPFVDWKTENGIYKAIDEINFETFLQDLYEHSKNMVLVPDIRFGKKYNTTIEEYMRIISNFMDILTERNRKPIFVPIQPTLSSKRINDIINYYKEQNFSNIWIDYAGTSLNEKQNSGVRMILRALDRAFGGNYIIYHSQMGRTLTSSIESPEAPSSDMLSQFLSADFIGCPVKPWRYPVDLNEENILQRGFRNMEHYTKVVAQNKSRVFNPETYYYHYPSKHQDYGRWDIKENEIISNARVVRALNTIYKFEEVERVKEEYSSNKKILPYIKKKKLFVDRPEIYNRVIGKPVDTSWFDI